MINYLKKDRWSAYLVGSLIGILLTALVILGHKIGASTGVARVGALVEYAFSSSHVEKTPYFQKILSSQIVFDWKILFIIALFFGSLLASKLSNKGPCKEVPLWQISMGSSRTKRNLMTFLGGAILLFGARIANGCTSGHAISGGAQLSVTSWLFMLSVFVTAIPLSFYLYQRKDQEQ